MRIPTKICSRLLTLLFSGLVLANVCRAEWLSESRPMMGTEVRVELWARDAADGRRAQEAVFDEFRRLDQMMNPWNAASALAKVNREAFTQAVAVPPEIVEVVQRAQYYSRISSGAFDISFASAGQHYDFRAGRVPSELELKDATAAVDYREIKLDPEGRTLRLGRRGMAIDLGGIAKGYAVDQGMMILVDAGIESAVITAGGDSRILGDMGDRPRMIGIRHPRKKDEYVVVIPLADTAISTSGDYERFFEKDGVRYHHILDPATGQSARDVRSVSVIASRAIDSDALSTTVFVMGVDKGLQLVNSLPGIDAIVVDGAGKLHYSEELLLSTTE